MGNKQKTGAYQRLFFVYFNASFAALITSS